MIVMSPKKVLIALVRGIIQCIKGTPYNQRAYEELFKAMYDFLRLARREGLIVLEAHMSRPEESAVFAKYPNAWVRLKRQGQVVSAYGGSDGKNWTELARMDVSTRADSDGPMPASMYVGIATTAHHNDAYGIPYAQQLYWNYASVDSYNSSYVAPPPSKTMTAKATPYPVAARTSLARVVIAEQWVHAPRLDPSGTSWLPAPFWLNGAAIAALVASLEAFARSSRGSAVAARTSSTLRNGRMSWVTPVLTSRGSGG